MKSYRDLDIYKMAFNLAIQIHQVSLELPKFELYEQGGQIRRSSKSVKDNIVEGYGRRRYKQDFIRFLVYAQSSCDETICQLTMINELYHKENPLTTLVSDCEILGKKINKFIQYVETSWQ